MEFLFINIFNLHHIVQRLINGFPSQGLLNITFHLLMRSISLFSGILMGLFVAWPPEDDEAARPPKASLPREPRIELIRILFDDGSTRTYKIQLLLSFVLCLSVCRFLCSLSVSLSLSVFLSVSLSLSHSLSHSLSLSLPSPNLTACLCQPLWLNSRHCCSDSLYSYSLCVSLTPSPSLSVTVTLVTIPYCAGCPSPWTVVKESFLV